MRNWGAKNDKWNPNDNVIASTLIFSILFPNCNGYHYIASVLFNVDNTLSHDDERRRFIQSALTFPSKQPALLAICMWIIVIIPFQLQASSLLRGFMWNKIFLVKNTKRVTCVLKQLNCYISNIILDDIQIIIKHFLNNVKRGSSSFIE